MVRQLLVALKATHGVSVGIRACGGGVGFFLIRFEP